MLHRIAYIFFVIISFSSCKHGYQKVDDDWVWITNTEQGNHITEIITSDKFSFKILNNKEYAKDKDFVYWRGLVIEKADPKSFKIIGNSYSKDKNYVFLDNETVIFANPKTFKTLKWPYSYDGEYIFNGNLPLQVNTIKEFKIVKTNGSKITFDKSFFIEQYKEYKWLDSIKVESIIISESAVAKTNTQKITGVKKQEHSEY